ncbi:F0F1 ATP synthase subunit alpha [Patescibacteria group bacterium]|jgi:F-type H+-transporting ATPase subunit alpha|nr:F0F1 ATP synthase subunit alpha [Patescibacteria group bacterium]
MDTAFIEKLKADLTNFSFAPEAEAVGRVVAVGDGIVEATGLASAQMAELVVFDESEGRELSAVIAAEGAVFGLVLNLEEESSKIVVLGDTTRVREGMYARATGTIFSVPTGEALTGRVVNALGEPIDGLGAIATDSENLVERQAYGVIDRESVNEPLMTGIKAVDAMIPVGRGQRELIIGDRFTGKTTVAIDTIINQKNEAPENRPICVYVSIGQKDSKVARIVGELKEQGAMEYTTVVNAGAATPAALQFIAPFAGVAIAEYFMDKGKDVLIVYDDLSKHAVAYREVSLLLRRPPGREAYPGDIFYLHSRLLERSAKLNEAHGGGSITALPIIETQENDVSAYIPTNVISITDGQIYLTTDLFNKGIRPAIDVGVSVSRVGSSAQTKAMKKVAGKLRLELAQYYELEAFAQFASDLDPETKARLDSGARMVELLKQGKGAPMPLERQVLSLYAGTQGYLTDVAVERVREFEAKLFDYVEREHPQVFEKIRTERALSDELEGLMKQAIESFKEAHPDLVGV